MKVTIEEAKQKWCPLFFVGAQNNPSFRGDPENNMCSADECMMWREHSEEHRYNDNQELNMVKTGYCGLACRP